MCDLLNNLSCPSRWESILHFRLDVLFMWMNYCWLSINLEWTEWGQNSARQWLRLTSLGCLWGAGVCRTIVPPNHTNTVNQSSWLKISTPETTGTQQTQTRTAAYTRADEGRRWSEHSERTRTSSDMPPVMRLGGNSYCLIVFSSCVQVHERTAFLFPSFTSRPNLLTAPSPTTALITTISDGVSGAGSTYGGDTVAFLRLTITKLTLFDEAPARGFSSGYHFILPV